MKNKHLDEHLEKLIGKKVRLEWFDGMVKEGILNHNRDGRDGRDMPYCLITDTDIWVFYKSHIKHIKKMGEQS